MSVIEFFESATPAQAVLLIAVGALALHVTGWLVELVRTAVGHPSRDLDVEALVRAVEQASADADDRQRAAVSDQLGEAERVRSAVEHLVDVVDRLDEHGQQTAAGVREIGAALRAALDISGVAK